MYDWASELNELFVNVTVSFLTRSLFIEQQRFCTSIEVQANNWLLGTTLAA